MTDQTENITTDDAEHLAHLVSGVIDMCQVDAVAGPKNAQYWKQRIAKVVLRAGYSRTAEPAERKAWKAQGARRAGARGPCATCYVYLKNHGRLDDYAYTSWGRRQADDADTRPCDRCGVPTPSHWTLCGDCALVVADLNEAEAWG